jgi:hypothetical protein
MTDGTRTALNRKADELGSGGSSTPAGQNTDALAPDLLRGAEEIAAFLFGDKSQRRKVYHLAETSRLPVFRLGSVLCARRSILMAWIAEQEQRALRGLITTTTSPKE